MTRHNHSSESPERLLALAQAGDQRALGKLLELFRAYLFLISRVEIDQRLRAKADPSDLVQQTFLEAHRDFAQFRGQTEKELIAWLRKILARNISNLVREYRIAQRRDVALEQQLENSLDQSSCTLDRGFVAAESSPSQRAVRRERAVVVAEALERLPDHYRNVVILRHLQGLSFEEIAGRMDRTVDSVKKLWARSLAQLRDQLGDQT